MIDMFVLPTLVLLISYFTSNDYFSKNVKSGATIVLSVVGIVYVIVRMLNG